MHRESSHPATLRICVRPPETRRPSSVWVSLPPCGTRPGPRFSVYLRWNPPLATPDSVLRTYARGRPRYSCIASPCTRPCTRFVRAAPSCRLLGYSIPQPLGPHGADLFRLAERVVQSDSRRPTGARHGERCRSERRGSAARCCAAHLSVALRAELWLELRLLLAAHAADVLGAYYQGGWEQAGRCQGGRGGDGGLSVQHTPRGTEPA